MIGTVVLVTVAFLILIGLTIVISLTWSDSTEDKATNIGYSLLLFFGWVLWTLSVFIQGVTYKVKQLEKTYPEIKLILAKAEYEEDLKRAQESITNTKIKYQVVIREVEKEN